MEHDFTDLQRLLALKRHEVPPPGYFHGFAARVVARIDAAETARHAPWWQKLGLQLNLRPALVCALGVVVCGLLSAGVITSMFQDAQQPVNGFAVMGHPGHSPLVTTPFVGLAGDEASSSTQPVFSASRFDQFGVRTERAVFAPPGR